MRSSTNTWKEMPDGCWGYDRSAPLLSGGGLAWDRPPPVQLDGTPEGISAVLRRPEGQAGAEHPSPPVPAGNRHEQQSISHRRDRPRKVGRRTRDTAWQQPENNNKLPSLR